MSAGFFLGEPRVFARVFAHASPEVELRVSSRKLFAALLAILFCGLLLSPLIYYVHVRGWLVEVAIVSLAALALGAPFYLWRKAKAGRSD
jgi:hypothetical protein